MEEPSEGPGVEDGVVVEEPEVAATVTKEYHNPNIAPNYA